MFSAIGFYAYLSTGLESVGGKALPLGRPLITSKMRNAATRQPRRLSAVFRPLGGVRVFVDQAVEDGFSADVPSVGVCQGRGGKFDPRSRVRNRTSPNRSTSASLTMHTALLPSSRRFLGTNQVRRKPVLSGLFNEYVRAA
jgi:hypothetical protein